ncbi:hypothetical protein BHG15_13155 [Enterococcus hirae]|nr:hypothetical protein BH737_11760 [Enterococcus hirae]OQO55610.1 hypothetical protein BHG15_13155 [Enterococcus hirae]
MDSLVLANTKINLDKAFNNFFRDEYVVVQKKKMVQSCTINNQNGTIVLIDNKYVKVSKLKFLVKIKLYR